MSRYIRLVEQRQLVAEGRDWLQILFGVGLIVTLALAAPLVRMWASAGWGL